MSKHLKSFLIVCLVVCMTACLAIFATACKDDDPKGDYLTVTVELPDHSKVKDVEVDVCTEDGLKQLCLERLTKTDKDGVAKFNLVTPMDVSDSTKFLVKIKNESLPDGYIYADDNGDAYDFTDTHHQGRVFDTTVTTKSVTITLKKVEASDPVGTEANPQPLTLNTPADFEVTLATFKDMAGGTGAEFLSWEEYCLVFTSGEAGTYQVTATSDDGYTVTAQLIPADENDYSIPNPLDNNKFSDVKASTAYKVKLENASTINGKNAGDKITYTVTVSVATDDGDEESEDLIVGTNNVTGTFEAYYLTVEAGKTYTITVTDGAGAWTVNGQDVDGLSTVVVADGNATWVEVVVNGACTITITVADTPAD